MMMSIKENEHAQIPTLLQRQLRWAYEGLEILKQLDNVKIYNQVYNLNEIYKQQTTMHSVNTEQKAGKNFSKIVKNEYKTRIQDSYFSFKLSAAKEVAPTQQIAAKKRQYRKESLNSDCEIRKATHSHIPSFAPRSAIKVPTLIPCSKILTRKSSHKIIRKYKKLDNLSEALNCSNCSYKNRADCKLQP
ncbi:unnamed protein product [Moneuplotes crassus]|uniref:Uncharacterized protein n=1 Tax=Euplotes crassus TaxID=5936 RepID=A0AAD1XDW4_EUPCR|nr:unnamed protein product [Moneuplotes crassus]